MSIDVRYKITVDKSIPIIDVVGVFFQKNQQIVSTRKLLQAVLIVIDKVEKNEGILLQNSTKPKEGNCVYFSAGFPSFEKLVQFLESMDY